MLSKSWEEKRQDKSRRTNLFRDLSRIILSLGRIPLARIGSFTLDNTGVLSLSNRPLTLRLQILENRGISINMTRENTYTAVEPYILDLLAYHDSRLRSSDGSSEEVSKGPAMDSTKKRLPKNRAKDSAKKGIEKAGERFGEERIIEGSSDGSSEEVSKGPAMDSTKKRLPKNRAKDSAK